MPTEFSVEAVNDYFAKLNPIAAKIALDIDKTISAYEHIWTKLNPNERNEIIDETLMKTEISLRYFDNFSINTSVSSLSLSSIVSPSQGEGTSKKSTRPTHSHHLATRRFYDFDGRNLSTYAGQKVGLKLIHDETLGTFRDRHSMPFSYKTLSQINLRLFEDDGEKKSTSQAKTRPATESLLKTVKPFKNQPQATSEPIQLSEETLKKLQSELASSLSSRKANNGTENTTETMQDIKSSDKVDSKYKRFYDEEEAAADGGLGNRASNRTQLSLFKVISSSEKSNGRNQNSQKYGSDVDVDNNDEDRFERMNLMANCSELSGGMTTSSSSAPSEDDEKTLCEDLKLLIDNDGIRKGFDFLNNW